MVNVKEGREGVYLLGSQGLQFGLLGLLRARLEDGVLAGVQEDQGLQQEVAAQRGIRELQPHQLGAAQILHCERCLLQHIPSLAPAAAR